MPCFVNKGAKLMCSMGSQLSDLEVEHPNDPVYIHGQNFANIMDYKPMVNIKPFGLCSSLANPSVAAATAAAMGVLTPMPCMPNTTSPWMPGSVRPYLKGEFALMDDCRLMCAWAGTIEVADTGQVLADKVKAGAHNIQSDNSKLCKLIKNPYKANGDLKPLVNYKAGECKYDTTTDAKGRVSQVQTKKFQLSTDNKRLDNSLKFREENARKYTEYLLSDSLGSYSESAVITALSGANVQNVIKNNEQEWLKLKEAGCKVDVNVRLFYGIESSNLEELVLNSEVNGESFKENLLNDGNK